jgi:hypothetical protein
MLRKLTSLGRVPALLSFALLLAMLAPVSASSTGNGGGGSIWQHTDQTGRDFDISLKSKWSNDFKSDWLLKPIFSMFREYVVPSGDHISDHISDHVRNDENKHGWGMYHRAGGFAKSHYRWGGYRGHGPVVPVVPEPSTAVLMLLGLTGLAVSNHRMRS